MDEIRFGMIGCGTVAGYGHLPGITNAEGAELVAVSDLNEARLAELKEKYGVETYANYHDLLARDDIHAVGIATPLDKHHQVLMDAASAGKHALCEKPIAQTVEDGEEMVSAMEKAGKLFAINFELRWSDPVPTMKRLLDEGAIGELKVMRFVGNWMGGRWAGEDRYRMLMTEGLGAIVDCGIHDFDKARWFSGSEFDEIYARGTNVEDWPNPDHVMATCRMKNGVLVHIETGWAYTHNTPAHEANLRLDLIGTDGLLSYVDWQTSIEGQSTIRELSVYTKDKCYREPVTGKAKAFDRMYSLMAQSIREGRLTGLPSGRDGVEALRAALEALRQAKAGSGQQNAAARGS